MQTLILVDTEDTVVGYAPRTECHLGNGKLHRAIAVALFNERQEILLQKRKSFLWDGFWDIAGATHPLHLPDRDETYGEAAQRFLRAEWNAAVSVRTILSFTYFERFQEYCENEVCALLVGTCTSNIQSNPDFAYDMRWVPLEKCLADLKQHPLSFTPWAKIVLEKLPGFLPV